MVLGALAEPAGTRPKLTKLGWTLRRTPTGFGVGVGDGVGLGVGVGVAFGVGVGVVKNSVISGAVAAVPGKLLSPTDSMSNLSVLSCW